MANNAFSICLLQMRRHVDGDELLTVVCRSPAAYNNYWQQPVVSLSIIQYVEDRGPSCLGSVEVTLLAVYISGNQSGYRAGAALANHGSDECGQFSPLTIFSCALCAQIFGGLGPLRVPLFFSFPYYGSTSMFLKPLRAITPCWWRALSSLT